MYFHSSQNSHNQKREATPYLEMLLFLYDTKNFLKQGLSAILQLLCNHSCRKMRRIHKLLLMPSLI